MLTFLDENVEFQIVGQVSKYFDPFNKNVGNFENEISDLESWKEFRKLTLVNLVATLLLARLMLLTNNEGLRVGEEKMIKKQLAVRNFLTL